jgi:hypothetical protein
MCDSEFWVKADVFARCDDIMLVFNNATAATNKNGVNGPVVC